MNNKSAKYSWVLAAAVSMVVAGWAQAETANSDSCVHFSNAWTRVLVPETTVTAGYGELHNGCDTNVSVVSAQSEAFESVSLHETVVENDVSQMRALEAIALDVDQLVELTPGGLHLMLHNPAAELKEGESVSVQLNLDNDTQVVAELKIRGLYGQKHAQATVEKAEAAPDADVDTDSEDAIEEVEEAKTEETAAALIWNVDIAQAEVEKAEAVPDADVDADSEDAVEEEEEAKAEETAATLIWNVDIAQAEVEKAEAAPDADVDVDSEDAVEEEEEAKADETAATLIWNVDIAQATVEKTETAPDADVDADSEDAVEEVEEATQAS